MIEEPMRQTTLIASILIALCAGAAALAQSTGAVAPTAPPPWSGESGSSGHPQMTAEAIRADAANFQNCLEGLWPAAARRHVSRATFVAATKDLTPDLR